VTTNDWPFGPYPAEGLRRLGPHVTAFHGSGWPYPNSAVIRGGEGLLVFDANLPWIAPVLRASLDGDSIAPPLTHLVLSHAHGDHAHGSAWFAPPARTWARAFARDRLAAYSLEDREEEIAFYSDAFPGAAEAYRDLRIVVPEETVEAERVIDLGGVTVRLVPEPIAHTAGDLWAVVEPDGVVLAGDLWCKDIEGYLGDGSVAGAAAAIDHLRDAGGVCLPGHGPAAAIEADDPFQRYALWILERTTEARGRGLAGEDLQREVRAAFDAQADEPGAVGFPVRDASFLEEAVASVEEAARVEGRVSPSRPSG
jgi:glyoxylase-like metal-dependent hydrolase (beta-lactamase superfamily II)